MWYMNTGLQHWCIDIHYSSPTTIMQKNTTFTISLIPRLTLNLLTVQPHDGIALGGGAGLWDTCTCKYKLCLSGILVSQDRAASPPSPHPKNFLQGRRYPKDKFSPWSDFPRIISPPPVKKSSVNLQCNIFGAIGVNHNFSEINSYGRKEFTLGPTGTKLLL